jgi:bifunctional UDP-N-acetylglucosamine pyrophosphorylase/glucosamine-1-phosphate N-acetyltransferase
MAAGVTLEDPSSIHIDDSVQIGQDSLISPGCIIQGTTSLGQNVTVGPGCVVYNSEIADNAQLRAYCVLENAKVGAQALIGPFARLRPGTELANKVHIGNFVETKKAKIGEGSKANHLTYLGDCEIGTAVNIGAGTITCNYDGVHKHKTEIGDGVFVGSDSQFVAPVKVGKGAYIAAGSTITKDVPEESLAIARSRQTTKADYFRKKRD